MTSDSKRMRFPLDDSLGASLAAAPDSVVAITDGGQMFTAAELLCKVQETVRDLPLIDNPTGRWGLYTDSSVACLIGLIALLSSGRVPVLLPSMQREILRDSSELIDGFMTDVPALQSERPICRIDLSLRPDRAVSADDLPSTRLEATLQLFTSGSTGAPVLITKSVRALAAELSALDQSFGHLVGDHPVLATVSHQHIYGLLFRVLWPFARGQPLVDGLLRYPHEVTHGFREHPAAWLVSSPAFLKRAASVLDFSAIADGGPTIFSSGGPLPPGVSRQLAATGRPAPIEVFGSTETGGIAFRQGEAPWRPLPGVEVRVTDGLLEVRSPHLEVRDWWRTEDRAESQVGGHFILKGRADRTVKIEEKRVNLGDLEVCLNNSVLVNDSAALVLRNRDNRLGALVVPSEEGWSVLAKSGRDAIRAALNDHLTERFESAALPRYWRFVKSILVNTQGKRSGRSLEAMFDDLPSMAADFPKVIGQKVESSTVTVDLHIPPSLSCLEGHFPDAPVVAGIIQIGWVDQLVRRHFGMAGTAHRMDQIKFRKVLMPNADCRIHIEWDKDAGRAKFEVSDGGETYASGRLFYDEVLRP